MLIFFELSLVVGLLAVASNPSPYFAALGLVGSAGAGCLILMSWGTSFLSLVLFLVYLGGMMVVFAYSSALVAEPYPEAWGSVKVVAYLMVYVILLMVWYLVGQNNVEMEVNVSSGVFESTLLGLVELYLWGGFVLLAISWALLVSLFSVLEVVRGHYGGALRAV